MKKIIVLTVVVLIAGLALASAQEPPPDLKIRIITERPLSDQPAELVVFYTTSGSTAPKDSINLEKRQIIHFKPQPILIDNILDTIKVDASYLENTDKILDAYRWPGKPTFLIQDSYRRKAGWFGFRVKDIIKTDTTKFSYQPASKKVEVVRKKEINITYHTNHWLISSWIVFLGFIALAIIFRKVIDRVISNPEKATHWQTSLVFTVVIVWIVALFSIFFSRSIWLLIVLIVLAIWLIIHFAKRGKLKSLKQT